MISPHNPIFRRDNSTRNMERIKTPIVVATMVSLLFPIASRAEDRGDCIYWNRQMGARNLM